MVFREKNTNDHFSQFLLLILLFHLCRSIVLTIKIFSRILLFQNIKEIITLQMLYFLEILSSKFWPIEKNFLIKRYDNSLSRMIPCIMKKKNKQKKTQRVRQACSCYNLQYFFPLNKVSRLVRLYWSELTINFWNFCTIKFALLRKRTKKGVSVGLEQPDDYFFM